MYLPAVARRLADVWFDSFAGLQIRLYTSSARLDVQPHSTVCERFPRVDMLSLLRLTRSKYSWLYRLRPKIHRSVHRRPAVCHLENSTEVLLTEHINHWVPETIPPFQGFTRIMGAHHPVQFQRSPIPYPADH